MLKFIINFLKNREVKVKKKGTISDYYIVNGGIPQGLILSPNFLKMTCHIPIHLPSNVQMISQFDLQIMIQLLPATMPKLL